MERAATTMMLFVLEGKCSSPCLERSVGWFFQTSTHLSLSCMGVIHPLEIVSMEILGKKCILRSTVIIPDESDINLSSATGFQSTIARW